MQGLYEFAKTTLVGGLLVVLPLGVCVWLLAAAVQMIFEAVAPVAEYVPAPAQLRQLIVLAAAIGICFVAGLVVRTGPGRWAKQAVDRHLLERIPGYALVRGVAGRFVGQAEGESFAPALVELEESLVPAFVVERHRDGRFTVYVPAVPTPVTGSLYIMEAAKVHLIDVSFSRTLGVISQWGAGSQELLAAMKGASECSEPPPDEKPDSTRVPERESV